MKMNTKYFKKLQRIKPKLLRELWKSKIEVQHVNPQTRDQLNKEWINKNFNLSRDLSVSLNVWELRSFHINHIKNGSTKFQMSEEWGIFAA